MDSENPFLGPIVRTFSKISNEHCLLKDIEKDKYELDIRECKEPDKDSGKIAMCADIVGEVHTEVECK